MKKLNLGCGKEILEGYTNLDIIKLEGTDIVHDLNEFPYPFKDSTFDEILAKSVLEHLWDLQKAMEELWRISKPGAVITIWVPHFESLGATVDPTHKLFFSYYSFDYYCKGGTFKSKHQYDYYSQKANFMLLDRKIIYPKYFKILELVANKMPRFHEIMLRKFLPVRSLFFKLEVIK